jgi:hypothetical protein
MNDNDGALAVIIIAQWVDLAPGSDFSGGFGNGSRQFR